MLSADEFTGSWQLSRVITDRHSDQAGTLLGTARFETVGAGALLYTEVGELRFGTSPAMTATRSYRWQFVGDAVDVRFDDGAAFHSFRPSGHAQGTDHPCGADFYQVRYDFSKWPQWQATWQVIGPRKDYESASCYWR
ncbi:DUF6314 family protein [Yoonia maritima]|nr:DUF6314 family protein [Yoonia maritima]